MVQVHLDVFEYYTFWFAYYAVCKDPNSSQGAVASRRSRSTASRSAQLRTQIESWASSIPRLHHSPQAIGAGGSPYLQLLKLYLSHFVVFANAGKALPGSSGNRGLQLPVDNGAASHGDILISTLIEFWLIDDDSCPLPLAVGFQATMTYSAVLSYIPPGSDLTDSLKVLIKFLNSNLRSSITEHWGTSLVTDVGSVYSRKPIESPIGLFGSPMSSPPGSSMLPLPTNPYSQTLQRPLYRFLLRAFQLWPIGTPIRKLLQVVEVWLDYLEPWNVGLDAANARHLAQWHWLKDSDHVRTGESLNPGPLSRNMFQKQGEGTNGHRAPGLSTSDHGLATDVYTDQWQVRVKRLYYFPFY